MFTEINIDGLVGPTHHFGGLGVGNIASLEHRFTVSHPKQAALEGLQKARLVASLGIPQFIFLPPPRPSLEILSSIGFYGTVAEQIAASRNLAPRALSAAFSSAFMWLANAATVTAPSDSADDCLHCTPANLSSSWHRASEASERSMQLDSLLASIVQKRLHQPLPSIMPLRDEGAANHMRLCDESGAVGLNVFVYGYDEDFDPRFSAENHLRFAPRHTLAAAQAIARIHQLQIDRTFFLQQHPLALNAGVFHNDVIATSCDSLLLHHELAFIHGELELQRLETEFQRACGEPLQRIIISDSELPLADAVRSYFFNSQIIKPKLSRQGDSNPRYLLICPHHCEEIASASSLISRLIADPKVPIDDVRFVRLEQSMANGGGPACLRLRMSVRDKDLPYLNSSYQLTAPLFDELSAVIEKWYPAELEMDDFCNVDFVTHLGQIDVALRGAMCLP